jgi:hypothetical protein
MCYQIVTGYTYYSMTGCIERPNIPHNIPYLRSYNLEQIVLGIHIIVWQVVSSIITFHITFNFRSEI